MNDLQRRKKVWVSCGLVWIEYFILTSLNDALDPIDFYFRPFEDSVLVLFSSFYQVNCIALILLILFLILFDQFAFNSFVLWNHIKMALHLKLIFSCFCAIEIALYLAYFKITFLALTLGLRIAYCIKIFTVLLNFSRSKI